MRPRGDAATGELNRAGAYSRRLLVLRQRLDDQFRNGICNHAIKELCRVYISRKVKCEYCGNQRSEKGKQLGLVEGQYDELLNFESSSTFTVRQKAALAYAETIAWQLDTDDAFWSACTGTSPSRNSSIGLTLGQQSWLRLLNIEHNQIMAGTTASMAPASRRPRRSVRARCRRPTGRAADGRAGDPQYEAGVTPVR